MRVIAWARLRGVPLMFRGDSHRLGRRHCRPPLFGPPCACPLFAVFRIVPLRGRRQSRLFQGVRGAGQEAVSRAPLGGWGAFQPGRSAPRAGRAETPVPIGFLPPTTRVVLFAGKLVPAKGPRELLMRHISKAASAPDSGDSVFVGEGSEKEGMRAMAEQRPGNPAASRVRFLPFANQSEMPARYLLADVFALPSRGAYETWGLAVNEAMRMGIPCLVSERVGCQRDLVTPVASSGWVFDSSDPEASLGRALARPSPTRPWGLRPGRTREDSRWPSGRRDGRIHLRKDHRRPPCRPCGPARVITAAERRDPVHPCGSPL